MSDSKIPNQHIVRALDDLQGEARGRATVKHFMMKAGLAYREGRRIRYKQRNYNMFQVGEQFARAVHDGEHFKWIPGVYYTHVKAVAARLNEERERTVAIQHDTVESLVKNYLGPNQGMAHEEAFIAGALKEIGHAFRQFGCDFDAHLPDLDVLTKRRNNTFYENFIRTSLPDFSERLAWYNQNIRVPGVTNGAAQMDPFYAAYGERIILHTLRTRSFCALKSKKSDANDNGDPDRNRPESMRDKKDHFRLAKYDVTLRRIDHLFPEDVYPIMRLRPQVADAPADKQGQKTADKKRQKKGKLRGNPRPRDWRQKGGPGDPTM